MKLKVDAPLKPILQEKKGSGKNPKCENQQRKKRFFDRNTCMRNTIDFGSPWNKYLFQGEPKSMPTFQLPLLFI
jgi:hypothetical protein